MQQGDKWPNNRGTYDVFTIYCDVAMIYYDNCTTCYRVLRDFTIVKWACPCYGPPNPREEWSPNDAPQTP